MDNPKNQRPIDSDIYGSDQLYKLCDVLYVKLIPWKLGIHEKFMVFHKDMYSWLNDHKIYGNGNVASFDPYGRSYYFYLKMRAVRDEKNVQDIYIEQMFKKDVGGKEDTKPVVVTPKFDSVVFNQTQTEAPKFEEKPLPTVSALEAFGSSSFSENNEPF